MKSRCGFYSKLEYCEGVVEELGGEVGELGGEASPPLPPVDETLCTCTCTVCTTDLHTCTCTCTAHACIPNMYIMCVQVEYFLHQGCHIQSFHQMIPEKDEVKVRWFEEYMNALLCSYM